MKKVHEILEEVKSDLPPKVLNILQEFIPTYIENSHANTIETLSLLKKFIECVVHHIKEPYHFELFHESVRSPFDYYKFGLDFIRPLIDFTQSYVSGLDQVEKLEVQLKQHENVILLSNHQIEPDPQIISLLLEAAHPVLAEEMIFVAGHRVITDPLAVPFSLGCHLLCIYSKKHMSYPQQEKPRKVLHNQKTLQRMVQLLQEGGKCIYVAPSGGRDRANAKGIVEPEPFDPGTIELLRLLTQQVEPKTHFYPLAICSHSILPPPSHVEKEIGEMRNVFYAPVKMAFGPEIDIDCGIGGGKVEPIGELSKKEQRTKRAESIWNTVCSLYCLLKMD